MSYLLPAVIVVVIALALLLPFLLIRFVAEWLTRKLRKPSDLLIADRLPEHLEALRAPRTVGQKIDRSFERLVGRSALGLTPGQATGYLMLVGVFLGGGLFVWRDNLLLAVLGLVGGPLVLLGFYVLMHWLWTRQVQEQLPDGFHLLARSLRAGLTVEQSLKLLGDQGEPPLAGEFKRCAEHLELGLTVPAALQMTADRMHMTDFNLFVSMLVIHRQTGGSLAMLMDRMASTVRARNQFRGQVRAITALGRLSGVFLAVAAPVLMVAYWVIYPDYLTRLTDSPQGISALTTAIVLEVVGVAWLAWLLRVDY